MIEQQAAMVKDPDGRKKLLQDIQRYILNSAHLFPLYGLVDQRLRWKYVQDWPEKVFMAEGNQTKPWMLIHFLAIRQTDMASALI